MQENDCIVNITATGYAKAMSGRYFGKIGYCGAAKKSKPDSSFFTSVWL